MGEILSVHGRLSVPCGRVVSRVQLYVTPWTLACQALLYMGFSSKSIGLPVLPPGGLSDPGIKPMSYTSPAFAGRFFTTEQPGKARLCPEIWPKHHSAMKATCEERGMYRNATEYGCQGQSHFRSPIVWAWPGPQS